VSESDSVNDWIHAFRILQLVAEYAIPFFAFIHSLRTLWYVSTFICADCVSITSFVERLKSMDVDDLTEENKAVNDELGKLRLHNEKLQEKVEFTGIEPNSI
jgi:hypothetical protein